MITDALLIRHKIKKINKIKRQWSIFFSWLWQYPIKFTADSKTKTPSNAKTSLLFVFLPPMKNIDCEYIKKSRTQSSLGAVHFPQRFLQYLQVCV